MEIDNLPQLYIYIFDVFLNDNIQLCNFLIHPEKTLPSPEIIHRRLQRYPRVCVFNATYILNKEYCLSITNGKTAGKTRNLFSGGL